MATLEVARASAAHTAQTQQRTMYVVKDTSRDLDPALSYFAADDETIETFFAGLDPLEAFEPK